MTETMRELSAVEVENVSGGDGVGTGTGLGIAVTGVAAALLNGAAQSVYNQTVIQQLDQTCPSGGTGQFAVLCA